MATQIFTWDGEQFPINLNKITFAEGDAIERVTGHMSAELNDALKRGQAKSVQAVFWVAVKRKRPTTTFASLGDVSQGDVDVEFVPDETDPPEEDEGQEGAGAPPALAAQREEYLADFAHVLHIRPWEIDLLDLRDFQRLVGALRARREEAAAASQ